MNLLTDTWVPVRDKSGFRQIRYQDLLCEENDWEISLPRDDMELACLQLLVCLTQIMFMPTDVKALRGRIRTPLTVLEFDEGTKKYRPWFDLDYPETPFMQTKNTDSKDLTPVQKLFVGLPAGNNHAFFNESEEIRNVCGGCAAIALFNQNSSSPNISGKHKGGLRGSAPITTFVMGNTLRATVWCNVLTLGYVKKVLPNYGQQRKDDEPTWVKPIKSKATIRENQIGLLRGLFWVPIHVLLNRVEEEVTCDGCGSHVGAFYRDFKLGSDFKFTVNGQWPHPHSPRVWNIKKQQRVEKYLSFTTTAPAWTQLNEFLIEHQQQGKEGHIPAAVVSQFSEVMPDTPLHLKIGGYRNKQASILQRRHELFSIAQGWDKNLQRLGALIETALESKNLLRNKLYFADKGDKKRRLKGIGAGVYKTAEELFYQVSEQLLHETLRSMNFREYTATRDRFLVRLSEIALEIFKQVTVPYTHKPELIPIITISRRDLEEALSLMKKEQANMPSETSHHPPDFVGLFRRYESLSPGQKAELRRVLTPDDLRDIPSLYRLFPGHQISDNWLRVAFLLPHCGHRDGAATLGSQLATAKVNEARLFQVVRAKEPSDLIQLRRLVFQVQPTVDWKQFGWMLLAWNKEKKRELLEDYFISKFNT